MLKYPFSNGFHATISSVLLLLLHSLPAAFDFSLAEAVLWGVAATLGTAAAHAAIDVEPYIGSIRFYELLIKHASDLLQQQSICARDNLLEHC